MFWIHIEVTDLSILHIFKYKQYKNANIANFCVLRENSNKCDAHNNSESSHSFDWQIIAFEKSSSHFQYRHCNRKSK